MALDLVNDTLIGTQAAESWTGEYLVFARGGNDTISLGIESDDAPDQILLKGQTGDDIISVRVFDVTATLLLGGSGDDDIFSVGGDVRGGTGSDIIENTRDASGIPNATIRGGASGDRLIATATEGHGKDVLRAGDGDDRVIFDYALGTGRARVSLGDGADILEGRGRATVLDFNVAEDVILVDQDLDGGPDIIRQRVIGEGEDAYLVVRYTDPFGAATILRVLGRDAPLPDYIFVGDS